MGSPGKRLKPYSAVQLVECPECEGLQTPVQNSGHDEDGRHIRIRRCQNCGHRFGTVELRLPPEFSFYRTNVKGEDERTYTARYSKDRIVVGGNIRIIPGEITPYCKKGLHRLEGDNLRPRKDGTRQCWECLRIAARARRLVKGEEINKWNREWHAKNKEKRNRKDRERYHRDIERSRRMNRESQARRKAARKAELTV